MIKTPTIENSPDSYEFTSQLSVSEAVSKLSLAVKEKNSLGKDVLRGDITNEKVYLNKHNSLFVNIFRPVFVGKFSEQEGGVMLEGKIKMHWFGKLISILWFTIASIIGFLSIFSQLSKGSDDFIKQIIFVFLFLLGGVLIVKLSAWFARKDKVFIIDSIRKLLLV